MKNEKSLNSQLREAKLIIFLCKVLLTIVHNAKVIQIFGLLIALGWCGVLYYNTGSLSGTPIIILAGFLMVRYYWIPTSNLEFQRNELKNDIIEYTQERDFILEKIAATK